MDEQLDEWWPRGFAIVACTLIGALLGFAIGFASIFLAGPHAFGLSATSLLGGPAAFFSYLVTVRGEARPDFLVFMCVTAVGIVVEFTAYGYLAAASLKKAFPIALVVHAAGIAASLWCLDRYMHQ